MNAPSLEQALAALPDTPDGIAALLREQGIRGVRTDPCACPLAVYLTGLNIEAPSVTESVVSINGAEEWMFTPDHIEAFVRRFDGGAWPELVEVADA
jgi:hypothetical protein